MEKERSKKHALVLRRRKLDAWVLGVLAQVGHCQPPALFQRF